MTAMEDTAPQTEQTSSKKGMNPMTIAVIIIVLLLIAGGAYAYMRGQNKPVPAPVENAVQPTIQVSPTAAALTEKTIEIDGKNFSFTPSAFSVKKGDKVTINFKNVGGFHNFVLDEFKVKTDTIGTDKTATVTFTADKTGTFEYYCSVGNHRAMGMKGTLTVTE